jgi:hypothetical protein
MTDCIGRADPRAGALTLFALSSPCGTLPVWLRSHSNVKLLTVKKVSGSDPLMYMFWSKDNEKEGHGGYLGRMEFAPEEDVRKMLMTHGLSEAEANAELSRVGWA